MKINIKYKDQQLDFDKRSIPALIFFFVLLSLGVIIFIMWRNHKKEPQVADEEKITIATSIFPFYDMARNIVRGVDTIDLVQIIPNGASPHTFEPTAQSQQNLSKARVVFIVGVGFDDWVNDMIDDESKIIDLSKSVDLIPYSDEKSDSEKVKNISEFGASCIQLKGSWLSEFTECENISQKECEEIGGDFNECASSCRNLEESNSACIQVCVPVCTFSQNNADFSGTYDPHYWLSIQNAKKIINAMYNTLAPLSENKDGILYNNAIEYITTLDETNQYIDSRVGEVQNTYLVTYHNSFGYFARDYDFDILMTFEEKEGQEPSAKYLKELTSTIKDYNITTLYVEPQMSQEVVTAYAQDNGLTMKILDPLGGGDQTDSYINLLLYTIHTIADDENQGS